MRGAAFRNPIYGIDDPIACMDPDGVNTFGMKIYQVCFQGKGGRAGLCHGNQDRILTTRNRGKSTFFFLSPEVDLTAFVGSITSGPATK